MFISLKDNGILSFLNSLNANHPNCMQNFNNPLTKQTKTSKRLNMFQYTVWQRTANIQPKQE